MVSEYGDWVTRIRTGGKDMMKKMAIGISQPKGKLLRVTWSEDDRRGRLSAPMHPIGSRLYGLHDLVMVKDKQAADDDDDDADSIVYCRGSAGTNDGKGGDGLRYFFVNSLSFWKME